VVFFFACLLLVINPLVAVGDPMSGARPPGEAPPSVWLGTAPFCRAEPSDCAIFGLEYVCGDRSGDGLPCFCGEKVLCRAPAIARNPDRPDSLTAFTLVQYNILDRPYIVGHEGQRERMCRIPQALARLAASEPIDAVVFNESFSGICVPGLSFREMLAYYGWRHTLPTISPPLLAGGRIILSNGGIFIASRWPILASEHMIYRACAGSDCLAAKGVQYAKIQKTVDGRSKFFHVFGTHLQGYRGTNVGGVRRQQLREMAEFIETQAIPRHEPVLLAGDFNVRGFSGPDFQNFVETLRVSVPAIVGERRGTMDVDNTLFSRGPWWVDYVLPSALHQQPDVASMEVVALKAEQDFAICAEAKFQPFYVGPWASTCTRTQWVRDLSDHYPVIGRFMYPR
jgi:endonuclease/exonuclease/phosphatase family metal-dependent hydrolase